MKGDDIVKGMKIGIDIGSSSLKMFAEGKGIVVDEPAVVAIDNITENPIALEKPQTMLMADVLMTSAFQK